MQRLDYCRAGDPEPAPYVHPKILPVVYRGDDGKPVDDDVPVDIRELARRLALVFTQADPAREAP